MKLCICVETDWSNDACTPLDVPDDATPEQITEAIDALKQSGGLNVPDLLQSQRACTTLTVWRTGADGLPLDDGSINECEESW